MSDNSSRRCETTGRYETGVARMRVKAMTDQGRPIQCRYGHMFAAMALLLALLIPASASAGARVSDEAVAQWETQWENYGSGRDTAYEKDADEALLDAFSGDEFDGAVVESYAIEAYGAREGAAILRLADGALYAYALALDDAEIWRIVERTGDLSSVEGADNARVSYWSCMTVSLYGDGQPKCGLEFRDEQGELTLRHFSSQNADFVSAYVSELEELRFDDVWWSGNFRDPDGLGEARVTLRADAIYSHTVLESESIARMDEFGLSFREFDFGGLFDVLSAKTKAGISYIDEDMTFQAIVAREANGWPADIPVLPELPGFAYALPAPVLAHFAPNQRFDVYTGPEKQYMREADGKASLSTNDWVLVFGEEDGWLMVLYRVNEKQMRFGFIEATQEQAGVSVPVFSWADEPVKVSGRMTNDPFYGASVTVPGQGYWDALPGRLIGAFGSEWAYVEMTAESGAPVRGFVFFDGFHYAPPEGTTGCIALSFGEYASLYDAPGGKETGRLYPGASVAVKEEKDGMLCVAYYPSYYENESLDVRVQGWIDAQAFAPGVFGWTYLEEQDFEPMRVMWLADEVEDIREYGTPAYALMAEAGDTAYLEVFIDSRGVQAPQAKLRSTTRAWLCLPEDSETSQKDAEDEEEDYVELYWRVYGLAAMSDPEAMPDGCLPGTVVDVIARVDGAALVVVHEYSLLNGIYWVDERYVVDVP